MKKRMAVSMIMVVALFTLLTFNGIRSGDTVSEVMPAHLPSSLDNLYPPAAQAPVYLLEMFTLAGHMTGIFSDLSENDVENARVNFENFKAQYIKTASLVPEWQDYYQIAAVDELGAALEAGDQEAITAANNKVESTCHNCHLPYMPAVQQKYRWGAFDGIYVTDPLSEEDVVYAHLMRSLELNFTGIGVNIGQGQIENAGKHLEQFKLRFETFKETCEACHDSDRRYFISEDITGMIDNLQLLLAEDPVDGEKASQLLQGIGMESCSKCHLVHVPATYAKYQWQTH